jgi:large subunit ribosomal protein L15
LAVVKQAVKVVHLQKVTRVAKAALVTKGGQMPIQRRLPKRGFKNINRVEYVALNIGKVDYLAEKYNITEFSLQNLYINGLIAQKDSVKLLGHGEIKGKYSFKVNAVSEKAKAAVEAAGGSVEIIK